MTWSSFPRALTALATSLVVFSAAAEAAADEPSAAPPPASARTESRWYGYQTLAADAVALGAFVLATKVEGTMETGLVVGGVATYALAPAVVHGIHGNPGRAVGDVALRLLIPATAGALGGWVGSKHSGGWGALGGIFLGGAIGMAAAVVIDAAVLAYDDEPSEPAKPAAASRRLSGERASRRLSGERASRRLSGERASRRLSGDRASWTVAPHLGPTRDGFAAGLHGTF